MLFRIASHDIELKIDSGADVNIITATDWESISLKGRVGVSDITKAVKCGEKLLDYSGREIPFKGSFIADIETVDAVKAITRAKFYVAASRPQAVLSYTTARNLNVLKIGHDIQSVGRKNEIFPTMPIEPIKFEVDLTIRPRLCIYNNIPAAFEERVNNNWDDLEAKGIIEPVKGRPVWLSRVEIVPKRLGGFRIVIDMRAANKAIFRIHYPMPNQENLLNRLKGAKIFSKLDFSCAYFHIPIAKESRYLTAFMTKKGAMQYTRLPFGINCAPEIFQRIMDETFGDIEGLIVYLDDLLIFAKDRQALREITKTVRDRIKQARLTVNEEKCVFETEHVEFLGLVISEEGIKPAKEKIDAIVDFPRPGSYKDLRGFLGLVTFISSHLQNFSTESEPLRRLLMGKSSILKGRKQLPYWRNEQETAFTRLKEMAKNEVLTKGFFDPSARTLLHTDASNVGLGAVLQQINRNEESKVIACASKSLTKTERAYPQTQREALAAVWGTEKFRYHLAGRMFTIITDHDPLRFIFGEGSTKSSKRAITRAEGWALRLSPYRFDVETVRSEQNIADALSRQFNESQIDSEFESEDENKDYEQAVEVNILSVVERTRAVSMRELVEETLKDQELQSIVESIQNGRWEGEAKRYRPYAKEITGKFGIVIRASRIIIPRSLQTKVMSIAHRSHPGMSTTKHLLRQDTWWLGMDRDIERYIENCLTCVQLAKQSRPEPLVMTTLPDGPWQSLGIDFYSVGEIKEKLLVIADYYSRFLEVVIMNDTTSEATIGALGKVFEKLGWPTRIRSDNGPQFVSEVFKKWAETNGIQHDLTTPRFAQENGLVERYMKGITRTLSIAKIEQTNWKQNLLQYINDYNTWPHSVTLVPPRELLCGRVMRNQLPSVRQTTKMIVHGPFDDAVRAADFEHKSKKKEKTDRQRRALTSDLTVGDYVHIKKDIRPSKIDPIFTAEKYLVTARNGGRVVIDYNGKKLIRKTVHLKKALSENEQESPASVEFQAQDGPSNSTEDSKESSARENTPRRSERLKISKLRLPGAQKVCEISAEQEA